MTPAPIAMRQLSRARLTPRQVAAVMVMLCQAAEGERLTTLPPLRAADFDVDATGDLILTRRAAAARQPAVEVLIALLGELTAQVDPSARGASLLRIAAARTHGLPAFGEVSQLRAWAEQTFDIGEPRQLLQTIDWPAVAAPSPREAPRATRRLVVALFIVGLGLGAHVWRERAQDQTLGRAGAAARESIRPAPLGQPPVSARPASTPVSRPEPPEPAQTAGPADRRPQAPLRPPTGVASTGVAPPAVAPAGSPQGLAQASLRLEVPDVEGPVFSPSFADDGRAMFFHTRDRAGARLIEAAVGADDELVGLAVLSDDRARNYHLRLAPDGRRVAFDSDREGERAVYVANRDGTGVRRVSGAGYAAVPSWSPDAAKLAFVRAEDGRPRVWNLWLADLGTGDLTRLTAHRVGQTWGASWFPDGVRIAYSHETALRILDLETGAVRRFDSPRPGRLLRTPAVSPDGRRVVFQVQGDGAWLLTLDDGAMRRILDDASAEEFTWHPSGGRFAYHSRRDGHWRIWITALPEPAAP